MNAQLEQMKGAANQSGDMIIETRKSVASAKTSADIAARVSVPTLVIETFDNGYTGAANLEAMLQYPIVKVLIKNYGPTPAFLRS